MRCLSAKPFGRWQFSEDPKKEKRDQEFNMRFILNWGAVGPSILSACCWDSVSLALVSGICNLYGNQVLKVLMRCAYMYACTSMCLQHTSSRGGTLVLHRGCSNFLCVRVLSADRLPCQDLRFGAAPRTLKLPAVMNSTHRCICEFC